MADPGEGPGGLLVSLTRPLPPYIAVDVSHHQHLEGGSSHSGIVFVTDVGM